MAYFGGTAGLNATESRAHDAARQFLPPKQRHHPKIHPELTPQSNYRGLCTPR